MVGAHDRHVRVKVIGVFRHQGRILVGESYDPVTKERFYCPPGGGVEFGERCEAALRREIQEELGSEIENLVLRGVLENLFTFDGRLRHEIVFVYEGELVDKSLYALDQFQAQENGQPFMAIWLDLEELGTGALKLVPEGLLSLVQGGEGRG